MKRKITLTALLAAVAFSSYALGQNAAQLDDLTVFEKEIDQVEDDLDSALRDEVKAGIQGNSTVVSGAIGNGHRTQIFTSRALAAYYMGNDPKALARIQGLQVEQNQKLIEQNGRIIELLEQLNAKK